MGVSAFVLEYKVESFAKSIGSHRNRWRIEVSMIMREEGQVRVQGEGPVNQLKLTILIN